VAKIRIIISKVAIVAVVELNVPQSVFSSRCHYTAEPGSIGVIL
jgi:hypothetical protein